jgi:hypothetical protein
MVGRILVFSGSYVERTDTERIGLSVILNRLAISCGVTRCQRRLSSTYTRPAIHRKKKKGRKNGLEAFRSGCCEGNTTRTLRELVKEGISLVLLALLMLAKLNTSESQHQ